MNRGADAGAVGRSTNGEKITARRQVVTTHGAIAVGVHRSVCQDDSLLSAVSYPTDNTLTVS
jgi:hypothetical protein